MSFESKITAIFSIFAAQSIDISGKMLIFVLSNDVIKTLISSTAYGIT